MDKRDKNNVLQWATPRNLLTATGCIILLIFTLYYVGGIQKLADFAKNHTGATPPTATVNCDPGAHCTTVVGSGHFNQAATLKGDLELKEVKRLPPPKRAVVDFLLVRVKRSQSSRKRFAVIRAWATIATLESQRSAAFVVTSEKIKKKRPSIPKTAGWLATVSRTFKGSAKRWSLGSSANQSPQPEPDRQTPTNDQREMTPGEMQRHAIPH